MRIPTYIRVISFLFLTSQALAQSFQLSPDSKDLMDVHAIATDDYFFVVGLSDKRSNSIRLYALSRQGQQVQTIEMAKVGGEFIGCREAGNNVYLYLQTPNTYGDQTVTTIKFSKDTRTFGKSRDVALKMPEWPTQGIVSDDVAVTFSFSTVDKKFSVLKDDGEKSSVVAEFLLKDNELRKLVRTPNSQRNFYYKNESLLLVNDVFEVDKNTGIEVVSFNLNSKTIETKTIDLGYSSKTEHNSFLFKDQLFVWAMAKEFVALDIYDITTLQKIKSHVYKNDDPFVLNSGDAYVNKETFDFFRNATSGTASKSNKGLSITGKNTSDMRSVIGNKIPTIHVDAGRDSSLEIKLGTYSPETHGTMVGAPTPNGIGGATPGPVSHYSKGESARFIIGLMDRNNLEPISNQWGIGNSESRKIDWINNSETIQHGRFTTTRQNERLYIVYFDADKIAINVEELR